ncbi:MAG: MotA/TolQ/ExbB proton channel family protein [Myxococcota bacterium]
MVEPFTMMKNGGIFMWPIVIAGAFAAVICMERLFYVLFRAHINAPLFMSRIQKLVVAGNLDSAIKMCNAEPHAALPRVVKAGLMRANLTDHEIQNAVDEAVLEVAPLVSRRTPYLTMIANVATLLGLLGTIIGLITAFEAVSEASAEAKQLALSSGIAIAMYTTAGGLFVAIPTLLLHSIIVNRSNRILDDLDQFALKTVNLLVARKRGTAAAVAGVSEASAAPTEPAGTA